MSPLILGSASPRRREILAGLGVAIVVLPADIDESVGPGEAAAAYLERIVGGKLRAVARRLGAQPARALLVADTSVVIDGEILGKPQDTADAVRLLSRLCGRVHRVHTRYAIGRPNGELVVARTVTTEVTLRAASADEIERYARSGEGLDKAGAYAAQGIGSFLVERVNGSYTNVVGLPACEVVLDLKQHGLLGPFP
ncbi:MAG TPA: Maf family protein [Polyangiaceae bacterium]|nr:Maf family protein [Polyangiaceae bacterium]